MLKLSLRSLRARKLRFALTAFAVLLGVSFVVAAFVLSDSLRRVFDDLGRQIGDPIAVQVRSEDPFGRDANLNSVRPPVPASLIDTIAAVQGVTKVDGNIQLPVQATSPEGKLIWPPGQGAPTLGLNWDGPDRSVSAFTLVEGQAPSGNQVALDVDSAKRFDITIGETVDIRVGEGSLPFVVSGLVRFGSDSSGAYYILLDTATAQRLTGTAGTFQTISIEGAKGVSKTTLRDRVAAVLPAGYEAVTGDQVGKEFTDSFGQIISIFRTALLAFALVALIVSMFIISNTFAIVLGQRVRELGMLRAVGARRGQVMTSVLVESLVIGILGSIGGALAGLGVAKGIIALLESTGGGGFSNVTLILSPTTWLIALIVGIVVTLISGALPAVRAGRLSPVAALREGAATAQSRGGQIVRVVLGSFLLAVGAVTLLAGLFAGAGNTALKLTLAGGGALGVFFGVSLLSVFVVGPVARALGTVTPAISAAAAALTKPVRAVFRRSGASQSALPNRLAVGNAVRNPRRTASTAAALMIGLALVGMALVVGESFKRSFTEQLESQIAADYFFSDKTFFGLSPSFAADVQATDGIGSVAMVRGGQMWVDGRQKQVAAVPPATVGEILKLDFRDGGYQGLDQRGIIIHKDVATDRGLAVGGKMTVEFVSNEAGASDANGLRRSAELTVVGILDRSFGALGNYIIATSTYEEFFGTLQQRDLFGGATLAPGASAAAVQARLDTLAERYPEVTVENRKEFSASQQSQIDSLLVIVNSLLFLSLFIALLGIINTMALSVFERTRELGLLRAVGMSRVQMRRMVRWESVIVAVFGAVLGMALGAIFGLVLTKALPSSVISIVAVPIPSLLALVLLAALFGVIAAILPARRAARLNVLQAIAYE